MPSLVFLAGLVVTLLGAEMLLRGAVQVARLLGVRPIVIGLTVVSIGTSMPELAVGIAAAMAGSGALAVGNIAGTNIFNILAILGVSAMLRPLPLHMLSLRLDLAVMIAASAALIPMAMGGVVGRLEGLLLLAAGVAYTALLVRTSRREGVALRHEFAAEYGAQAAPAPPGLPLPAGKLWLGLWHGSVLVAGIALTVLGGDVMVGAGVALARDFGVSEAVIGLTIVAIGTSAPELATTVVATLKGERDIAIGNLIGSCIYNILLILGLTAAIAPGGLVVSRDLLWIDLPVATLAAIVCLAAFRSGRSTSRLEGGLLVGGYLVYLGTLLALRT